MLGFCSIKPWPLELTRKDEPTLAAEASLADIAVLQMSVNSTLNSGLTASLSSSIHLTRTNHSNIPHSPYSGEVISRLALLWRESVQTACLSRLRAPLLKSTLKWVTFQISTRPIYGPSSVAISNLLRAWRPNFLSSNTVGDDFQPATDLGHINTRIKEVGFS